MQWKRKRTTHQSRMRKEIMIQLIKRRYNIVTSGRTGTGLDCPLEFRYNWALTGNTTVNPWLFKSKEWRMHCFFIAHVFHEFFEPLIYMISKFLHENNFLTYYWFKNQRDRQTEKERKLSACFFTPPKAHNGKSWTRAPARSQEHNPGW